MDILTSWAAAKKNKIELVLSSHPFEIIIVKLDHCISQILGVNPSEKIHEGIFALEMSSLICNILVKLQIHFWTQESLHHDSSDYWCLFVNINLCINQSINQSIIQSINQSINQPTNQSINQPTNQSINQSINQ